MITERPHSRARNVALIGLIFEVLLAAFFAIMMAWTGSEALRGLTLLAACGIPIWLYMVLVYHQRILVQEEEIETEDLRRKQLDGHGEALFDQEELLLAQRRLVWMYRWLLPIFTGLVVVLLVMAGLAGWSWKLGGSIRVTHWPGMRYEAATLAIWFVGGSAVLAFWLSRFASGLGHYPEWRMLRAGASWLMGLVLGAAAVAGTLAPLHYYPDIIGPERILAYVLRVLLLLLAVETLFNFVLDLYRPRQAGEEPRPAFESRLLGLFSEPGGIARSIADAVNYQFGFEVSSTWLYKLLERSALPLAGFAILMLFGASSFVIVQADQEAVVERFGRPLEKVLDPGLHVKYPWPIDVAYKVSTQRIHEFRLGEVDGSEDDTKNEPLILWTNKHEQEPHLDVLISTPRLARFMAEVIATQPADEGDRARERLRSTFSETGAAVSVSMLRVAMTIQYEIANAKDWISRYKDPEAMLRAIASHELTQHSATQTVEGMLGEQRGELERLLRKRISARADEADLGIRIKFLGLQGVHPPEETAEAFQDVIGAEQKRTASISSAEEDYNKRLSQVAGHVDQALKLNNAIEQLNRLESDAQATAEARQQARDRVRNLFFGNEKENINPIGGEAAGIIAKARAKRWSLENQAHADATVFSQKRVVKDAAPQAFYLRETLKAMAVGLEGVRKYVMAAEGQMKVGTVHLNLQDPASAQLDFSDKQR